MIISGSNSCYPNGVQATPQGMQMYTVEDHIINEAAASSSSAAAAATESSRSGNNFMYNLSILKDKIYQVQSLANFFISPTQNQQPSESTAIAIASIGTLIQEIIVTSTSVLYSCQHMMSLGISNNNLAEPSDDLNNNVPSGSGVNKDRLYPAADASLTQNFNDERGTGQGFYMSDQSLDWSCGNDHSYNNNNNKTSTRNININTSVLPYVSNKNINVIATRVSGNNSHVINKNNKDGQGEEKVPDGGLDLEQLSPTNYDIVELNAEDILAKYTHYCQVCGKGFKRDANLRMHMRAHGDEYKSSAALSNPLKNNTINGSELGQGSAAAAADGFLPRKYSCPHEGCRWNKKHAKFQPLKSMICVKNHYKRSHCPKMYVCKRCNRKQFSVLSDLRTHEKHCGDLKWQCSCGTTFSRKDKLMGHVALFIGHTPAVSSLAKMGKVES